MSELLSQLQQLGDGEIDDLSIAHDASEEIVALRLRVAELVEALEAIQKAATHESIHTGIQAGTALGCIAAICDVALAAHREGGGA